ncbi:hypothetical protein Tco_0851881 [Tanacetum coccineum]
MVHQRDFMDKRRIRVSAPALFNWRLTGPGELPELFLVMWTIACAKMHPGSFHLHIICKLGEVQDDERRYACNIKNLQCKDSPSIQMDKE